MNFLTNIFVISNFNDTMTRADSWHGTLINIATYYIDRWKRKKWTSNTRVIDKISFYRKCSVLPHRKGGNLMHKNRRQMLVYSKQKRKWERFLSALLRLMKRTLLTRYFFYFLLRCPSFRKNRKKYK